MSANDGDMTDRLVVHEDEYSIWPVDCENTVGWADTGKSGMKVDSLTHLEAVWTGMRPVSLRRQMNPADEL